MNNMLLLTAPNISLMWAAPPTLFLGTTEVLGGLEHYNYQTTYFDLNARLSYMHQSLSESDKLLLLDTESFMAFIKNPDYEHSLFKLVEELLFNINLNDYDIFAISVIRWSGKKSLSIITFHFAIILSMLLPKKTFMGGNILFKTIGKNHIKKIIELENSNVKTFLTGDGRENFPKFLNNSNRKQETIIHCSDNVNFNIRPSFNVKNIDDLKMNFDRTFSKKIQEKYQIKKQDIVLAPFRFSKGCIFNCSFCGTPKTLTFMTYNKVVDYLEYWSDHGISNFRFYNDNINFKQKWLFSFCNEIVKRNLKITFSDSANLLLGSEELYSALAEAGCIKLVFGAETLSAKMLNIINKKNKQEKVYDLIHLANNKGIWICANIICNFPYETEEDFNMTLQFLKNMRHTIDTIEPNIFYMSENSDYANYPEKYDIAINHDIAFRPTWYEINGLRDWRDIEKRGEARYEKILEIFPEKLTNMMDNDNIIYALRKQFDKTKTKEIMIEMLKENE